MRLVSFLDISHPNTSTAEDGGGNMAKPGKKKTGCQKYKAAGRLEINKQEKQLKLQKKLDKLAKRREEGKCYQYNRERVAEGKRNNYRDWLEKTTPNNHSNRAKHTPISKWRSVLARLNNEAIAYNNEMRKRNVGEK